MKLLFVCTGNVCRSVMGEQLMRKLAREAGIDCEAKSCGVAAELYFTVPPEVRAELKKRGIESFSHRPQLVSRKLLEWCDAALVMTAQHHGFLTAHFPEFSGKIHLLRRYAGLDDQDIADPMGRAPDVYAACCGAIAQALEALTQRHEHA